MASFGDVVPLRVKSIKVIVTDENGVEGKIEFGPGLDQSHTKASLEVLYTDPPQFFGLPEALQSYPVPYAAVLDIHAVKRSTGQPESFLYKIRQLPKEES